MIRYIALLPLLAPIAAAAQTAGGPPIAYVKRLSNGDEIHLVSPDGQEHRQIYKAKSKIQISMLDLKPGGGEVAFLENYYTLKILAFDNFGRPLPGNPRTIRTVTSPCNVESPDYHPSNGTLLFVEGCSRDRAVWTVQSGASSRDDAPLLSSVAVYRARWSGAGDAVYYLGLLPNAGTSDPVYLHRFANAAHAKLGPVYDWQTFDVTRVGDKVFWGGNNSFWMLDGSSGSTADAEPLACPRGTRMSRSPNDSQMVFQSPQSRGKGNYIMIGSTNCLTDPTALTGAGSWGWLDWRN